MTDLEQKLLALVAEAADFVERFAREGDPTSSREAEDLACRLRAAQDDVPWVYGFKFRPVHSSHVPAGVRIHLKVERAGFPTYGAAVLSRRLTVAEADHFDLTDLGQHQ